MRKGPRFCSGAAYARVVVPSSSFTRWPPLPVVTKFRLCHREEALRLRVVGAAFFLLGKPRTSGPPPSRHRRVSVGEAPLGFGGVVLAKQSRLLAWGPTPEAVHRLSSYRDLLRIRGSVRHWDALAIRCATLRLPLPATSMMKRCAIGGVSYGAVFVSKDASLRAH